VLESMSMASLSTVAASSVEAWCLGIGDSGIASLLELTGATEGLRGIVLDRLVDTEPRRGDVSLVC
jgi:hypothetical protein